MFSDDQAFSSPVPLKLRLREQRAEGRCGWSWIERAPGRRQKRSTAVFVAVELQRTLGSFAIFSGLIPFLQDFLKTAMIPRPRTKPICHLGLAIDRSIV